MPGELWASAFSLVGVVLGGGLTAFTQRTTQRSAERTERQRQAAATAEARRAEQVQAIKDFIACAQEAERAAYTRPESWGEDEDDWMTRAQATMTKLWIGERSLVLLCAPVLQGPVHDYGRALNQAVWREIDAEVNEHLEEYKISFMTAARASLADS
ncbi:hypothetical protein OHA40_33095 [Nocardia sp. NBC_00508]|uniref:hypothetical protein n=1 Tax=Nocardia sp. NBC_00508 TaxID=2975992 RepID=UPI002E81E5D8|nr:hypothetical protein [Nocardia sp. NBC_00508]WUD66330.1 hypothetical protein OHA40_33095 [Nocardia sp. NBC_00508]